MSKKDPLLVQVSPPSPGSPTSNHHRSHHQTYVAGEDASRLATAASFLGLDAAEARRRIDRHNSPTSSRNGRAPRLLLPAAARDAVSMLWNDSTLTAARMHSVGALGQNEVVDNSGTLHYISRRRRPASATTPSPQKGKQQSYGTLTDLFQKQTGATPVGTVSDQAIAAAATPSSQVPTSPSRQTAGGEEVIMEEMVEGGSLNAAIFGIVKGTVGPAILYLPRGFQVSGYLVAIPAMLFATFMYVFNAHRLLECWKVESDKNHKIAARMEEVRALLEGGSSNVGSNAAVVAVPTTPTSAASNAANVGQLQQRQGGRPQSPVPSPEHFTPKLLTYPELARRALGPYAFIVEFGIASMQFGVCLTYLIFVPQNLHECTLAMTGRNVHKIYFTLAMVLMEIPMSWIRDIRKLTPTNVLATILIAYGLCCVLVIAVMYGFSPATDSEHYRFAFAQNLAALPAITDAWFIFIGTSFFMMEGSITLLVPLQEAVFLPEDKAKFPMVNQVVTSWIVVFYICFSMICVAAFGAGIHTALTASLQGTLAVTVQMAYSIAVIFTFPLQAFPALEVAMKALLPPPANNAAVGPSRQEPQAFLSSDKDSKYTIKRNALATLLTCLLGVIAVIAIDYLGNVVSILGSLFGIPLALVFPPLMHNCLVDCSTFQRYANYGVVVIGFLAMAAASFATIVSWDKGAEGG